MTEPQGFINRLNRRFPISDNALKNVEQVLSRGRLYRYDKGDEKKDSEVALLERDFSQYIGLPYSVASTSCTAAMIIALRAIGVGVGDQVLIPGFTFTAVPSAIIQVGAEPLLVDITEDLYIDIDDLKNKISPQTSAIILSYMRGYAGNIDKIVDLCHSFGVKVIEDAAHALGGYWLDKKIGTLGDVSCFSFQSYKLIDSGEGGILATNDPEIAAKAILLSGAYEKLWQEHIVKPDDVSRWEKQLPCLNVRMSNLTAAVARPQLGQIEKRVEIYSRLVDGILKIIVQSPLIWVPQRPQEYKPAPDSLQFSLPDLNKKQKADFILFCRENHLPIDIFSDDNARCFWNWQFLKKIPELPVTRQIIESTFDMRLSINLREEDIQYIGNIILKVLEQIN